MARTPRFPSYPPRAHGSGQARIKIRQRDYYLGVFGSAESRNEYARLAAEFAANPHFLPTSRPGREDHMTVSSLIARWALDAEKRAEKGNQEIREILRAATILDRLFGATPAAEFDAGKLERVRDAMIDGSWLTQEEIEFRLKRKLPLDWCRNNVNHMINRIRKIFRWAELKRIVPAGTWNHLRALPPIHKSASVRKTRRRRPVEEKVVEATLPHVDVMVAAMICVQMRSGMRPSELVKMQPMRITRDGPEGTWLYALGEYKTDHLEGADEWQYVVLGQEAQKALLPYIERAEKIGPESFLWRPRRSSPKHLTTAGYYQAIHDACERAKVEKWSPYQLRHLFKRNIVRLTGNEHAARACMRQRSIQSTQEYASQQDLLVAARVMREVG